MYGKRLITSAICEVDGVAYIIDTSGEKPCIFGYNIVEGRSYFLTRVERADPQEPKMIFATAVSHEGRIVFVPRFDHGVNYLIIYEINTNSITYSEIYDKDFQPRNPFQHASLQKHPSLDS